MIDRYIISLKCNNKLNFKLIKKLLIKNKECKIIIFTNRIYYYNKILKIKGEETDIYFDENFKIITILNYLCLYSLIEVTEYFLYVENISNNIYKHIIKKKYFFALRDRKIKIYNKILVIPFYKRFSKKEHNQYFSLDDFYKENLNHIKKIYKKKIDYKEIKKDIEFILKKIKIRKYIYYKDLRDDLLLKYAVNQYLGKVETIFFLIASYLIPKNNKLLTYLRKKILKLKWKTPLNRFSDFPHFKKALLENVLQK